MSTPDNPWAFPVPNDANTNGEEGISLRDYFAAKVLPTIVQADWSTDRYKWPQVAQMAYQIADAILAERERPEE